MSIRSSDQEIITILVKKLSISYDIAQFDEAGNILILNLPNIVVSQIPPEIWNLTNLRVLNLGVPVGRPGKATINENLDQFTGQLIQLPPEIGQLTNLKHLSLSNNFNLLTPPPEIVIRGTGDILTFLQELQENSIIRHEAKLLIVGEGGTGKSSLLRSLRKEVFDPSLSTTHGIEVNQLILSHPTQPESEIILNTWDFGGQHIYHSTHQFFLTQRSLYLVVWNARLGAEQGRLSYWLETIKSLAPDAPVLLVATHIDERIPDLNYQLYKDSYPQLVGNLEVSNLKGTGLADLKVMLADKAIQLPLVGQPWPEKWLKVENALLTLPEHHISTTTYVNYCSTYDVDEEIAKGTLGRVLHDLGKILYFPDKNEYDLKKILILKPNWVTKAISRVLNDEAVRDAHSILQHTELSRIWAYDEDGQRYEPDLYPVFLRLMERFDLSYQIEADRLGDHPNRSLIPQLLPHQPPKNLLPWSKTPTNGQTQIEMVYRLDFVPTGIMSWFIVRTQRYTQNIQWREGVMLTYEGHQARVELNPMRRELRLLVWGLLPHNFFTILKNTVDLILARFQGLIPKREIPCNCHWERRVAEPCSHFYRYEELVRRIEAKRNKVECPETFTEVSVPMLLYGIHISTDQQVMIDIQKGQAQTQTILNEMRKEDLFKLDVILEKLNQQSELIGRNFTRQWNLEMQKMETECPNTFFLLPSSDNIFNPKNWMSEEYLLCLICQHPSGPHQAGDGYKLRKAEKWWITISPWLNHLITFLKFAVPMGKAIDAVYDPEVAKRFQSQFDLLGEMTKNIPELFDFDDMNPITTQSRIVQDQQAVGPALRALHSFIKEADHKEVWGGLHKTITPDGNILWLCGEHRQQYEVKSLQLNS